MCWEWGKKKKKRPQKSWLSEPSAFCSLDVRNSHVVGEATLQLIRAQG